jgi:hypothetical protein
MPKAVGFDEPQPMFKDVRADYVVFSFFVAIVWSNGPSRVLTDFPISRTEKQKQ